MSRNSDRIEKLRERVQEFYDRRVLHGHDHQATTTESLALLESALVLLDDETTRANDNRIEAEDYHRGCVDWKAKFEELQRSKS